MNTGIAQAALAARPTARTIRWALLGPVAGIASLMVWSGSRKGGDPLALHLPAAGMLLAIWVGFQFTDSAASTVAASPMTLLRRQALRVPLAVAPIAVVWALLCLQADTGPKTATLGALFLALAFVAVGTAAAGERILGPGRGGPAVVAGLFLVFGVMPVMFRVAWSLDPVLDSWHHLYGRFLWIAAIGMLAFFVASLDPARTFRTGASGRPLPSTGRAMP